MQTSMEWEIDLIDEEDIRDILSVALKDAGYHVSMASDGEKGFRLSEQYVISLP